MVQTLFRRLAGAFGGTRPYVEGPEPRQPPRVQGEFRFFAEKASPLDQGATLTFLAERRAGKEGI